MPRMLRRIGEFIGRSFFPLVAVVIILGTMVWGPWVSLALALVVWATVTRYA